MERLNNDDYIRPKYTWQDKLTDEEITEKLKYYKKVNNILDVELNTHIRYITINKNNETKFRLGGILFKRNIDEGYIVLSNGKKSWSVQIDNNVFFQRMTFKDLSDNIVDLEQKNKQLKSLIKEIKNNLNKDLQNKIDKIDKLEKTVKKLKKKLKKN